MTKTKNNLLVKLLVAVAFVLSAICMTACAKANKNISKISVVSSTVPAEIVVGKFDEAGIKIKVEYEDGSSTEMSVTTSMLDDNAKQLVNTKSGSYIITIKFRGEETKITVNVIEATEVHTVKFYNAYGYMIYRDDNVKHGQASTLPSDALIKCEGYTFVEWDRATDNVTGDTDVYGIYYRIDETMTSAQMEAKLVSANQYYRETSHTTSYEEVTTEIISQPEVESREIRQINYHYTSSLDYKSQAIERNIHSDSEFVYALETGVNNGYFVSNYFESNSSNNGWDYKDGTYESKDAIIDYMESIDILNFVLTGGNADDSFNVGNYISNATSKTYTYKKYTNGKNIYIANFTFIRDSKQVVAEVTFDDNKILSFKETVTSSDNLNEKEEYTLYINYVEKEFADLGTALSKDEIATKAKELITALIASNHSLVESKSGSSLIIYTYDNATKSYKNSDASVVLPIIAHFDANIDSSISLSYRLNNDGKYEILISLNGKLYDEAEKLALIFDNNKISDISYLIPTDKSVEGSNPIEYNFTVAYAD